MNFLEVDTGGAADAPREDRSSADGEFDSSIAKREQLQRLGIVQSSAGQNIRRRGKTPHITQEVRTQTLEWIPEDEAQPSSLLIARA